MFMTRNNKRIKKVILTTVLAMLVLISYLMYLCNVNYNHINGYYKYWSENGEIMIVFFIRVEKYV